MGSCACVDRVLRICGRLALSSGSVRCRTCRPPSRPQRFEAQPLRLWTDVWGQRLMCTDASRMGAAADGWLQERRSERAVGMLDGGREPLRRLSFHLDCVCLSLFDCRARLASFTLSVCLILPPGRTALWPAPEWSACSWPDASASERSSRADPSSVRSMPGDAGQRGASKSGNRACGAVHARRVERNSFDCSCAAWFLCSRRICVDFACLLLLPPCVLGYNQGSEAHH